MGDPESSPSLATAEGALASETNTVHLRPYMPVAESDAGDHEDERPQGELFEDQDVNELLPQPDPRSSPLEREAAANQHRRGAAFKLRQRQAVLWPLLLAIAAAASGFALAGRKLGGAPLAPLPSAVGEEAAGPPPPAEVPLPPSEAAPAAAPAEAEEEQPEPGEAKASISMTSDEEDGFVAAFEQMFVEGPHVAVPPLFLRGREEAIKQFQSFVANYEADLEGVGEEDEEMQWKKKDWTLFKMQMATLASMELMTQEQLSRLSLKKGHEDILQKVNEKLVEVYHLKVAVAKLWISLLEEGGLHPDSTNDDALLKLLMAQRVHYARAVNRLNGVEPKSTPEAANYKGDPRVTFKKLCLKLKGDEWLAYTMP
ncbi:hypothetical protein Esti_002235 [Eimeria stiedai]